ncbi:MAG: tRNA (adenosine(37)-N6)-dimethylallyltransferase MiaA [Bacteroidales bacterium]|nr:tRNA (adenosine(37)-N6)-dimethylallyltransferase MiaA [Bacteroidales bacterium]
MPRLLVITGPTAVGKTACAVQTARELGTEIISCDSRQFYREMRIGVARPSDGELSAVPHHFIACRSVTEPYNIYDYREDAFRVLRTLFGRHDTVVAVGGSGLYIDALLHPVAPMPDPAPDLRVQLQKMPLEEKRALLQRLDPDYYSRVDLRNPVRLQRALEVCLTTGRPYSAVIGERSAANGEQGFFETEVRVLQMDRAELRDRIDRRVDLMMQEGLLDEVRSLLPYRHLNTLNTVGYRELFPVLDGQVPLDEAVAAIKLNTWHYARKQMTWMRRYAQ